MSLSSDTCPRHLAPRNCPCVFFGVVIWWPSRGCLPCGSVVSPSRAVRFLGIRQSKAQMTRRRDPWHTNWRSYVPWIKSAKGSYRATTHRELSRSAAVSVEQARCCGGRSRSASLMRSMVTKRIRPAWCKMRRRRGLGSSWRKGCHMAHFSIFPRRKRRDEESPWASTLAVEFSMFDAITKRRFVPLMRDRVQKLNDVKFGFFRRAEARSGLFGACYSALSEKKRSFASFQRSAVV